jgi:hypothetical protein
LPAIRGFVGYLSYSKTKVPSGFTIDDLVDEIYLAFMKDLKNDLKMTKSSPMEFSNCPRNFESFMEKHYTKTYIFRSISWLKKNFKMEEKFTADADGELIMQEDLDDISYENTKLGNEILNNDALNELLTILK